jgi:transposase
MVGRWLEQAEAASAPGALSIEERSELKRLRRENRVLRTEREILKKAAAFFAKESL